MHPCGDRKPLNGVLALVFALLVPVCATYLPPVEHLRHELGVGDEGLGVRLMWDAPLWNNVTGNITIHGYRCIRYSDLTGTTIADQIDVGNAQLSCDIEAAGPMTLYTVAVHYGSELGHGPVSDLRGAGVQFCPSRLEPAVYNCHTPGLVFTDGPNDYDNDLDCVWNIDCPHTTTMRVRFIAIETEEDFDLVTLSSPFLVSELSPLERSGSTSGIADLALGASPGPLRATLGFESDTGVNGQGFLVAVEPGESYPGPVQALTAVNSTAGILPSVTISWSAPAGSSVTSYVIYRSTSPQFHTKVYKVGEVSGTEATIFTDFLPRGEYSARQNVFYSIYAVNVVGRSRTRSVVPITLGATRPRAPRRPPIVTATRSQSIAIEIDLSTMNLTIPIQEIVVYVSVVTADPVHREWVQARTGQVNITSTTGSVHAEGLEMDTAYVLRAALANVVGEGPSSNETMVVHTKRGIPTVSDFTSSQVLHSIHFLWSPPSNITVLGYQLTRTRGHDPQSPDRETLAVLSADVLSHDIYFPDVPDVLTADLSAEYRYSYHVSARGVDGYGHWRTLTDIEIPSRCPSAYPIRNRAGVITNGYNRNYGDNWDCQWVFEVEDYVSISFHIHWILTEENFDYVQIFNANDKAVLNEISGYHAGLDIHITENPIGVRLVTDYETSDLGFEMTYYVYPGSPGACERVVVGPLGDESYPSRYTLRCELDSPLFDGGSPITHILYQCASDPAMNVAFIEYALPVPSGDQSAPSFVLPSIDVAASRPVIVYCRSATKNKYGRSSWTSLTLVGGAHLPVPVANLTLDSLGATTLSVSWETVAQRNELSNLTALKVEVLASDNSVVQTSDLPLNQSAYTVSSLSQSTVYTIRVSVFNQVGSAEAYIRGVTTLTSTPPDTPNPPRPSHAAIDRVVVEWDAVDFDGGSPVSSYTLYTYHAESGNVTSTIDLRGSTRGVTVKSLLPGTGYYFRIDATNEKGTSPQSDPSELARTPLKPHPVIRHPSHIGLGSETSCVRFNTDQVTCWGRNDRGQCGLTDTIVLSQSFGISSNDMNNLKPLPFKNVSTIQGGLGQTLCVINNGELYCWGSGKENVLHNHPTENPNVGQSIDALVDLAPIPKRPTSRPLYAVRAGKQNICALHGEPGDMEVWCWGVKSAAIDAVDSPATIPPVTDNNEMLNIHQYTGMEIEDIALGMRHMCVLYSTGDVRCHGQSTIGVLGQDPPAGKSFMSLLDLQTHKTPFLYFGYDHSLITAIATSESNVCALFANGGIKCWGTNLSGRLGIGHSLEKTNRMGTEDHDLEFLPYVLVNPKHRSDPAIQIATGGMHICALYQRSSTHAPLTGVKCWGLTDFGRVGQHHPHSYGVGATPESMLNLDYINFGILSSVKEIAAAQEHSCALFENRQMRCWGINDYGQLGLGHATHVGDTLYRSNTKVPVQGIPLANSSAIQFPYLDMHPGPRAKGEYCHPNVDVNDADCVPCEPGTRAVADGCVACGTGHYTGDWNSQACLPCPPGHVSTPPARDLADCAPCPKGYHPNPSRSACEECSFGSYGVATALAECVKCPIGTYGLRRGASSLREGCESCPPKSTTGTLGSTNVTACNVCVERAVFVPSLAVCLCDAGYGEVGGDCEECPVNSYKSIASNSACEPCPGNTAVPPELAPGVSLASCQCAHIPNSRFQDGVCACSPGYTWDSVSSQCLPCRNSFKSSIGNEECTPCPFFSVTTFVGATNVTDCTCPSHSKLNTADRTCECVDGYELDVPSKSCKSCDGTSYKSGIGNAASCVSCPVGAKVDTDSVPGVTASDCQCQYPFVQNRSAATSCVCDKGYGFDLLASKCEPCSATSFKDEPSNSQCTPCPEYSIVPFESVPGRNRSQCLCQQFSTLSKDRLRCECLAGHGLVKGRCEPCSSGFYKEFPGNSECRPCPLNSVSTQRTRCQCVAGFYPSLDGCSPCPPGGSCDNGTLSAQVGFWREAPSASVFYECPSTVSCLPNGCAPAHSGTLCTTCAPGYSRTPSFLCVKCGSHNYGVLLGIYLPIVVVVAIYLVWSSGRPVLPAVIMIVNYVQIIAQLDIDDDSLKFLKVLELRIFDLTPNACIFASSDTLGLWLIQILLPVAIIAIMGGGYLGTQVYKRVARRVSLKNADGVTMSTRVFRGVLQCLIWTYFVNTKTSLSVFSCVNIGENYVMKSDPAIQCWTAVHIAYLIAGGICFLLGSVCVPLILWALLVKPSFLPRFLARMDLSSFKAPFRRELYWWEMKFMVRRALVVSAHILLADYKIPRAFVIVVILFESTVVHLRYRPYKKGIENFVEMVMLQLLSFSFLTEFLSHALDDPQVIGPIAVTLLIVHGVALGLLIIFGLAQTTGLFLQRFKKFDPPGGMHAVIPNPDAGRESSEARGEEGDIEMDTDSLSDSHYVIAPAYEHANQQPDNAGAVYSPFGHDPRPPTGTGIADLTPIQLSIADDEQSDMPLEDDDPPIDPIPPRPALVPSQSNELRLPALHRIHEAAAAIETGLPALPPLTPTTIPSEIADDNVEERNEDGLVIE